MAKSYSSDDGIPKKDPYSTPVPGGDASRFLLGGITTIGARSSGSWESRLGLKTREAPVMPWCGDSTVHDPRFARGTRSSTS